MSVIKQTTALLGYCFPRLCCPNTNLILPEMISELVDLLPLEGLNLATWTSQLISYGEE